MVGITGKVAALERLAALARWQHSDGNSDTVAALARRLHWHDGSTGKVAAALESLAALVRW